MKTKLFLSALCLILSNSFGQSWERTYGGSVTDIANSVAVAVDSGFMVAGNTNSSGAGMNDFNFVRIDDSGNVMWTQTYGGIYNDYCRCIIQTSDSGFIGCGNSNSFSSGQDAYLVKTDKSGALVWSKVIGDTATESAEAIVQTFDGGYCMAGNYSISNNNLLLLIRTDANGDTLWTRKFGRGNFNQGSALLQTPDSGFIITGSSYNFANNHYDVFVVRTDVAGDTLWTRYIDAGHNTFGYSLAFDGANYLVGGVGQENFLAISIDANGNVLWQHEYDKGGLDRCYSVLASGNDFLLGGYTGIFSNSDVLVIKIDNLGNELWSRRFDHTQTDEGWAIQSVQSGGFIIAGSTQAPGGEDMYVVRSECDFYPTVNISILDTICLGGDTIASTLVSNNLSGVIYQWLMNDSIIPGANQSTFAAADVGSYKLMATDTNGCSNFSNDIFIWLPAPNFTVNPGEACVGDIIKLGDFNFPNGRYDFYNWNFGDGATDTGFYATHVYADTGWFYVSRNVQTSNGNCNTYHDSVHITNTAIPPVDFDMLINSTNPLYNEACPGDVIEFIPYLYTYLFVRPPAFDATSYLWDFGDGNTDTAAFPVHTYSTTGMYYVTLTVTNHCGNQASVTDSILISNIYFPVGSFSWINAQGISYDTVQACENVTFYSAGGTNYHWNFGDGTIDTVSTDSIIHAFSSAGVYSVELIVTNGCSRNDTVIQNVIVAGTCTGITHQEKSSSSIRVIPNPFADYAIIKIEELNSSAERKFDLCIFDVQGKLLHRENISGPEIKIERGNLNSGIYFFTLRNVDGKSYFGKFVVN